MAPGSPPPAPASRSGAVQRAETALRGFTARQASRSPGLPQQPTITVAQRSGARQTAPPPGVCLRTQDGLLPRTRAQLPLWYVNLRQVVLDAYRAVAVVYRVANHVLGSLFEVSPLPVMCAADAGIDLPCEPCRQQLCTHRHSELHLLVWLLWRMAVVMPAGSARQERWYHYSKHLILTSHAHYMWPCVPADGVGAPRAQEFGPWWKWMVFDALLKLIARALARRSQRLESIFEAVGWL